ncbi:dTDP-4-amino-4,6-dideoxygalactose transaminase [Salsipaludibacter albus]|uniref:dTDP-4-amino-4,6-dideoxygalactose transaminase n=1 Tax=Salsipaludibacter albus TaxID=2849650 RepID=UPI001EE47C50|nr:dTDP-4-amino-4,6-dideoxygalactose transaminase [Salsipaludibacter albus]
MNATIPFNSPTLVGDELALVEEAVRSGHSAMDGPFSRRVQDLLAEVHDAADVILTTSCTDALELSALLLEVEPGDVVIVPSFTFVSTAVAFARAGASIRFADVRPDTLGIDPASVARLMDDRVRAVVAVHYGGIAADVDGLAAVLADHPDVTLVEDNAHGLFGERAGRPLGTFGRLSTLSFHETKNFVCGEGGALVLNDPADVARAHVLKDKGTNRRAFFRGEVDKYTWKDTGSSFGLSDLLAAFLWGQLQRRDEVLAQRRRVFDRYHDTLAPVADDLGLQLPVVPEGDVPGYHLFHVLLPDPATRDVVLDGLRRDGIQATFHYVPLHSSDGGHRFGDGHQDCPVTDDVSARLLRLPFFNTLADDDIDRTCARLVALVTDGQGPR